MRPATFVIPLWAKSQRKALRLVQPARLKVALHVGTSRVTNESWARHPAGFGMRLSRSEGEPAQHLLRGCAVTETAVSQRPDSPRRHGRCGQSGC